MSKIRKEMNQLLGTLVRSGKAGITTAQMRTVAVATGNSVALRYLDNATIAQQAALKKAVADKNTMFDQPALNNAKDDATVFGMAGTDKTLDTEKQEKIYSPKPVESTSETPDDKDMRLRNKVEDHRPNTSDHKADIAVVSEALKAKPDFPEILDRGEKDPVEKRSSRKKTAADYTYGKIDLYDQAVEDRIYYAADFPDMFPKDMDSVDAIRQDDTFAELIYLAEDIYGYAVRLNDRANPEIAKRTLEARNLLRIDQEDTLDVVPASKKTAADGAGSTEKQLNSKEHIPGVPDGSGPYGQGKGPGKGKGDGSGLNNQKETTTEPNSDKEKKPSENEIKEFFIDNPNPKDDVFHDWAEEQGFEPDDAEEAVYKLLTKLLKKPAKDIDVKEPDVKVEDDEMEPEKATVSVKKKAVDMMPDETVTITDETGVEKKMMPTGKDPNTGETMLVPEGTQVSKVSAKVYANKIRTEIQKIATEINQKLTTEEEDEVNQFAQRELVLLRSGLLPQSKKRIANIINGIVKNRK